MDNFVEFDGVQKTYDGENLVIKSLDLSIARGEFVTLLGPSGSGKSTALMLLAGFEQPTQGIIRLNGRTLNSVAPFDRNIGLVFQNYALFPHMTVADNISYPLRVRKVGRSEREDRVRKALDLVQLGTFGSRYPKQLSGGQQQRVAVARALVFDPELVLMDEPLGALDKKLREEMQVEIKHIHENLGITMVFVTHDQDEALTMSDRIAVFNDGRVQQVDKPGVLYERPANRFVADFVGETNMIMTTVMAASNETVTLRLATSEVVTAKPAQDLTEQVDAVLSMRPERLTIDLDGLGVNAISGTLVEKIYHGSTIKMVFALQNNENVIAQVRAGNPIAGMEVGTAARLSFNADDARAFVSG